MIGATKNFAAATVVPFVEYAAFSSPGSIKVITFSSGSVSSNDLRIDVTGGIPAYTYSWIRLSGSSEIGISSLTSNVVRFNASGFAGSSYSSVYRCTITDTSLSELTVDVSVRFSFETLS